MSEKEHNKIEPQTKTEKEQKNEIQVKAENFSEKFAERDLEWIQNLLDFFNSLERSITKELNETNFDDKDITDLEKKFLEIDYNDDKSSTMEKELFEEIKSLEIKAKQVNFLNLLVEKLGNKNDSSENLLDKTIEKMSEEELIDAFNYINRNSWYIKADFWLGWDDTINKLDGELELTNFRENIKKKLKKNWKIYNWMKFYNRKRLKNSKKGSNTLFKKWNRNFKRFKTKK